MNKIELENNINALRNKHNGLSLTINKMVTESNILFEHISKAIKHFDTSLNEIAHRIAYLETVLLPEKCVQKNITTTAVEIKE